MAHVTILRRGQVIDRFSVEPVRRRTELAVMTTFTTTRKARVHRRIERRRGEHRCGIVARATLLLCRDMVYRFRRCDPGRMAGGTVVRIDTGVVEDNTGEGRKVL